MRIFKYTNAIQGIKSLVLAAHIENKINSLCYLDVMSLKMKIKLIKMAKKKNGNSTRTISPIGIFNLRTNPKTI
jgi:hypothetical protein